MSITGSIIAGVGLAGSIGGAAISSHAAGKAADTQAAAADQAAQLQYKASQNALDFQKQQFATQQQNIAPWLQSGQGALSNLNYLLGIGGMPSNAPASPTAPGVGVPARPVGPAPANGGMPIAQMAAQNAQGMNGGWSPLNGTSTPVQTGMSGAAIPAVPTGPAGTPSASAPPVNTSLGGYGSLMQPFGEQWQAPTALTEQNDPGFKARLKLGTDALERSAAARGNVLTGGTAKALDTYAQDYASNEYGNVYNRGLTDYTTRYNQYQQQQANQFNRLAALSGVGQTAAGQLAAGGQAASNNVTSNLMNTAQNMGQQYNNAAAANASGYVGAGNAWAGALGNTSNSLQNLLLLKQLQGGGGSPAIYGGGSLYGI